MKYIGPAFSFLNLAREMRVAPIKEQAEAPLRIAIVGPAGGRVEQVLRALGGDRLADAVREGTLVHLAPPLQGAGLQTLAASDLVVHVASGDPAQMVAEYETVRTNAGPLVPIIWLAAERFWQDGLLPEAFAGPGGPQRLLIVAGDFAPELRLKLGHAVVELTPNVIGTGRRLPPLRRLAADRIIGETSRGNAEFAAFSNLPALIPVVGNLFEAGADMIVLTKNQVWMLYKLAAVYGRDLRLRGKILLEIAPVVGSGFVWRTIARELAALLPGLLGAVPKVLIAYVGTYSVGQAAAYYYREGRKPPKELAQGFYQEALARFRRLRDDYLPERFRPGPPALSRGEPAEPAAPEAAGVGS